MVRTPVFWIAALLISMAAYIYWPQAPEANNGGGGRSVTIEVSDVTFDWFKDEIIALGTTQANESITVTPQSVDRVKTIHFEDGQLVNKGQLLVTLEHAQEQAEVKELEIRSAEQQRQLTRLNDLSKSSATAESAIDAQQSLLDATLAQLSVAKIQLSEKFIYAPFAGTLGLRQISPGQLVNTNTDITTLDDVTMIKVEFQLPERFLNKVAVGQPVAASNVAYDAPFVGEVVSISSRVDRVTRSFAVRALFNNKQGKLRPGMLLQLAVETQSEQTLMVPESAIIPINAEHYVFVVEDGIAKRKEVVTGRRKPGIVEVLSGLEAGQQVVSQGVIKLTDGIAVNVRNAPQP